MSATQGQIESLINFMDEPSAIEVHDTEPEDDNCEMNEDEDEKVLRGITYSPKQAIKELSELGKRKIQPHATINTPKRRANKNDSKLNLLKKKVEADNNFRSGVLELLEQSNNEEANFHVQVIKLLEKRNEIAAKQLELTKQMHNNNN